MTYTNLIEDLVSAQTEVLGNAAIDTARGVDGLTVTEEGNVEKFSSDGVEAVENLVTAYVDDLGPAATITLQSAASEYADDLELPTSLQ